MKKKIILIIGFLAVFGFLFSIGVPTAKATTVAELQALIQQLQAQILALQQQLAQLQGEQPVTWCHNFNVNLKIYNSGFEVTALQTALSKEGLYTRGVTGTFDEYTASAVVAFQEKYASEILAPWGLAHGTGYVGSTTRSKLNKLYGCGVVKPYIEVISPNGGEQWMIGNTYQIKWSAVKTDKSGVAIYLIDQSSSPWKIYDIAKGVSLSIGSYSWIISSNIPAGANYKIQITGVIEGKVGASGTVGLSDESDNYFSVVSVTTTCTDSDGGKNYYIRGKGTGLYGNSKEIGVIWGEDSNKCSARWDYSLNYSIHYDCCSDSANSNQLNEAYCDTNGLLQSYGYNCPYGCKDGTCLSTTTTQPSITVLFPNGGEVFVQGQSNIIKWKGGQPTQSLEPGKGPVAIALFNETGENQIGSIYSIAWPDGSYTWDAKRVCAGFNYEVGINCFDVSPGKYRIWVGIRDGSAKDLSDAPFSIISSTPTCTDSDGGKDYYKKGVVQVSGLSFEDACRSSSLTGKADGLSEYFCDAATYGKWNHITVKCSGGCVNGACLGVATSPTCSDPDGADIYTKGLASDEYGTGQSDCCVADSWGGVCVSESNYVKEGLCKPSTTVGEWTFTEKTYQCPNGCKNGACLQTIVPSITVVSPNGGEQWEIGKTYSIIWKTNELSSSASAQIGLRDTRYDPNLGKGEATIVNTTNTGSYTWTIPSAFQYMTLGAGNVYKIVVYIDGGGLNKYDLSDSYFSIVAATTTEEILVPGYDFYVKTSDTGTGNWSFAKSSCEALGSGWSLPAMDQLRILYQKKNEIGDFKDQAYWSSDMGMYIHFSNGFENSMNPAMTFPAFRCVKKADGTGLKDIENQLASLAEAVFSLVEQFKSLTER